MSARVERYLVCVDLSLATDPIVLAAKDFAAGGRAPVELLYVADPDPAFVGHAVDTPEQRAVLARELREEHARLEAIATEMKAAGIETTYHVVRGAIADTILARAAHTQATAIMLGSNGHNRLKSLFLGSVTDAVLKKTVVPVVVVPYRTPSKD